MTQSVCYSRTMTLPEIHPINVVRNDFAAMVRRAIAGEVIYLGSFRKPQVALISVERLAELEAAAAKGQDQK